MTPRDHLEWLLALLASLLGMLGATCLIWALLVMLFSVKEVDVADADRHYRTLQYWRGER